ncbi:hypothetical protein GpartN1_g5321.t1 [Galdieria partita]|uniref:RRM domain-containing protein n=1 Tax=Galdieria partita TaxID=83374 RepID=A0A9C7PWX8_9RHOD|nr:hypothetical protein GpartN1_g4094.t1 [Galdieria partita]GJQ12911.1 hypothetical protein GpartN1_g4702.t1 [Galdieria partita]GJQ13530.1 hypothetical protein GpartN1_g5321.t1 [Galdieria partita]
MARRSLYVGGLDPQVTEEILWAAFIPFGDLLDVTMPLDNETQQHRGFAFIEFELPEDAASAKENMDDSEMFGRRLRVAYTRPSSIGAGKPLWADTDEWLAYKEKEKEKDEEEKKENEKTKENTS